MLWIIFHHNMHRIIKNSCWRHRQTTWNARGSQRALLTVQYDCILYRLFIVSHCSATNFIIYEFTVVTFRDSNRLRWLAIFWIVVNVAPIIFNALPRDELFLKRFLPATRAARLQAFHCSKGRFPFVRFRDGRRFPSVAIDLSRGPIL